MRRWPSRLWLVRHGQSAGNVAREAALEAGAPEIDIAVRDMDVPLSDLGRRQAAALGHWFARRPEAERPEALLASPYLRARETAETFAAAGGTAPGAGRILLDERLREREFGIFDRLTTLGVREKFPDEAGHRALLGKFYHRAPGGESWADVILRLRSALDTISLHHADRRVMIVCHQVVVLCLRYILEGLDEESVLAISREGNVVNCGVTEYGFEPDDERLCAPKLVRYNFAAPLTDEQAPVTAEPETIRGAR